MSLPTIVIPVGLEGAGDHAELRYALRSIDKHVPHGRVIIVGHKPAWVSDEVEHIAVEQIPGQRHGNYRANIRAACKAIPEGFIIWHDDMFAMRPVRAVEVVNGGPMLARIETFEKADGQSSYTKALRATLAWLEANGHPEPTIYDGCHTPLPVTDTAAMRDALLIARNAEKAGTLLCSQSIYGNLAGIGGRKVGNAKADSGWKTRTWVSTSDERFTSGAVGEYIRGRFPEPGRYES